MTKPCRRYGARLNIESSDCPLRVDAQSFPFKVVLEENQAITSDCARATKQAEVVSSDCRADSVLPGTLVARTAPALLPSPQEKRCHAPELNSSHVGAMFQ